jgi:hypothetical protein
MIEKKKKSRITNVSMLELMPQEQTNSSIAWKSEIHNFSLVNISTKKAKF